MNNSSVMVLSAASGAGHIRAAEALTSAFESAAIHARHVEVLKYTSPLFRKVYSDLYIELVNKRPDVLGWVYRSSDQPWKFQKRRLALDLLNTGPLIKLIKKENPAIAVCTHFLPAEILAFLKRKKLIDMPLYVTITDIDAHAMWLFREVDRYFVSIEETKVYLQKLGVPPERIEVTGIPIDPVFEIEKPKKETRLKFGLNPDLATILVSAGGFGVGPMESFIKSLDEITHPVQFIVVCGRNERLKTGLEDLKTKHPMQVVGYTKEMDAYMAASDILVGKAGGLTSSEALARGLVLVIVNPVPGQEERNSDHFLEEGAAIRCNNLPALAFKIDRLLGDGERLQKMKQAAQRLGRPHASSDIVSMIMNDLHLKY